MRMLTASTDEVDEMELAARDIVGQLGLNGHLLKNSVALLFCHPEFIETGVMRAVCDALPFDVIGCTTLGNSIPGKAGIMTLSVSVLTSDTVRFSAAMSKPLDGGVEENVLAAFAEAAGNSPVAPSLMIPFSPLMVNIGGEVIAKALFKAAGDTPVFGTTACDHTSAYDRSYTIFNGRAEKASLPMLLLYGDINPRFFLKVISEDKIQKQKAIITDSDGSLLREVNGIPLMQYLETLSISKDNGVENIGVVPFIVDRNDGSPPVARAMYTTMPEGHAVCGGEMPAGSTLAVGRLERDDVLATARKIVREALEAGLPDGLLVFPCMSRNLVLGTGYLAEMEEIDRAAGGRIPYHVSYAGGEKCPDFTGSGKLVNCFHNFTIVACAFYPVSR